MYAGERLHLLLRGANRGLRQLLLEAWEVAVLRAGKYERRAGTTGDTVVVPGP